MVQVSERVGAAQNGSMKAVAGSGMASMSEASMDFQPRMLEPSKPRPSLKLSSVNSAMGQEKCCQVPKVSTNLTSTILAPAFLASAITCLGVLMLNLRFVILDPLAVARCQVGLAPGEDWREGLRAMVTFLTVLRKVEADGFNFFIDAETDDGLDDVSDDGCADGSQEQRHNN